MANAAPLPRTIEEVARLLNCGSRTLERHIAAGRFPKADVRLGKLNRWKPQTVVARIDRQA